MTEKHDNLVCPECRESMRQELGKRLIDADELLGLLNFLEASTPIIEWQSQREAEARKRALWQVRAWVESRVDPESVVAA